MKKITLLLLSILILLPGVIGTPRSFAETTTAPPPAEDAKSVDCPPSYVGQSKCFYISNPKTKTKTETKVEVIPPRQLMTGGAPVAPGAPAMMMTALSSLSLASGVGEDIPWYIANKLTDLDYATYNYLNNTVNPYLDSHLIKLQDMGTEYGVMARKFYIDGTLSDMIKTFLNDWFNNNQSPTALTFPTGSLVPGFKPTLFYVEGPVTIQNWRYFGVFKKWNGYEYLMQQTRVYNGVKTEYWYYFQRADKATISEVKASPNLLQQYITENPENFVYADKVKNSQTVKNAFSDENTAVNLPYFPDYKNTGVVPGIVDLNGQKYWEVNAPYPDGTPNKQYVPINDPNAVPDDTTSIVTDHGTVIDPNTGTPSTDPIVDPGTLPQTPTTPTTDPVPGDDPALDPVPEVQPEKETIPVWSTLVAVLVGMKNNVTTGFSKLTLSLKELFTPITKSLKEITDSVTKCKCTEIPEIWNPWVLLLPYIAFAVACLAFLSNIALIILTLPFVPAKPFPGAYGEIFEAFKNTTYGGIKPYEIMISLVTLLLAFYLYKMIRRNLN